MRGGRFDELIQKINNAESELNTKINAVQDTANDAVPKSWIISSRDITVDNRALSARENNPNVSGSLRQGLESLNASIKDHESRLLRFQNIMHIEKIFDEDKRTQAAIYSNWDNSPLTPNNYTVVLRIPSIDYRYSHVLGFYQTQLFAGEINFETKTIAWSKVSTTAL